MNAMVIPRFKPPEKKRQRGRQYVLASFAAIIALFAWHNSAYLSANWGSSISSSSTARASRQRQNLENIQRPSGLEDRAAVQHQQQQANRLPLQG